MKESTKGAMTDFSRIMTDGIRAIVRNEKKKRAESAASMMDFLELREGMPRTEFNQFMECKRRRAEWLLALPGLLRWKTPCCGREYDCGLPPKRNCPYCCDVSRDADAMRAALP